MDGFNELGRILIFFGLFIAVLGAIIYFLGGNFAWFGNLPGDIKVEKGNFTFYFPLTTMIIISLIINILVRIFR